MNVMNKSDLVRLLCDLEIEVLEGLHCLDPFIKEKLTSPELPFTYEDVSIPVLFPDTPSLEWKYISLNFYILQRLDEVLADDILSVKEERDVKKCVKSLLAISVLKNIDPTLPYKHSIYTSNKADNTVHNYNILKCSLKCFTKYIAQANLRMLILPDCLQGILVGIIQIACGPLSKPKLEIPVIHGDKKFVMTPEIYERLLSDQNEFKTILSDLKRGIHVEIFVRELMIVDQSKAPKWFKYAISETLTSIFKADKGVESIAKLMLLNEDDSTKAWKTIEVLSQLVVACRNSEDFKSNVCQQVLNLLDLTLGEYSETAVYERLVAACIKTLYPDDIVTSLLLPRITYPLEQFVAGNELIREGDITESLKQSFRLIHGCFVQLPKCLPVQLLKPLVNIIFRFYHLTAKCDMAKDIKDVLVKYLHDNKCDIDLLLDGFLFNFEVTGVQKIRGDVSIYVIDNKVTIKRCEHTVAYGTMDAAYSVLELLETDQKILLFGYLLKCVTEQKKYFSNSNKDLLGFEESIIGNLLKLTITQDLMTQLAHDKHVQDLLRKEPDSVIEYVKNALVSNQSTFIVTIILESLIRNAHKTCLPKYRTLIEPLTKISSETDDSEVRNSCINILQMLNEGRKSRSKFDLSDLDKALEDITDPLLPVRGHALLMLGKLVRKKDEHAMERKQYLLTLFQLSLKDEDSYIYLNAVEGLAALADVFPDTVIEVLCEEYSAYDGKNERVETRMKLGEVLVRIIKSLGETAPKYKAVLLNTFLHASKDDDHLIRASSLSNLGEVCRVLGYKLGTIITEVMVCVHAVIATDKAVEARRAAVTVIRQLFVGLESEMISFLKDDILPIYRTLKEIYGNDEDDVMRLQAQLALEELNENMKNIILPRPQLRMEKKIEMLDQ